MLVMWAIWKERTRGPSTVRRREAPMNWWTPFGRMVSSGCLPELSGWRLWDGRIPQPELQVFLEIPRCSSSPTIVSAQSDNPRICIQQPVKVKRLYLDDT